MALEVLDGETLDNSAPWNPKVHIIKFREGDYGERQLIVESLSQVIKY